MEIRRARERRKIYLVRISDRRINVSKIVVREGDVYERGRCKG